MNFLKLAAFVGVVFGLSYLAYNHIEDSEIKKVKEVLVEREAKIDSLNTELKNERYSATAESKSALAALAEVENHKAKAAFEETIHALAISRLDDAYKKQVEDAFVLARNEVESAVREAEEKKAEAEAEVKAAKEQVAAEEASEKTEAAAVEPASAE